MPSGKECEVSPLTEMHSEPLGDGVGYSEHKKVFWLFSHAQERE